MGITATRNPATTHRPYAQKSRSGARDTLNRLEPLIKRGGVPQILCKPLPSSICATRLPLPIWSRGSRPSIPGLVRPRVRIDTGIMQGRTWHRPRPALSSLSFAIAESNLCAPSRGSESSCALAADSFTRSAFGSASVARSLRPRPAHLIGLAGFAMVTLRGAGAARLSREPSRRLA